MASTEYSLAYLEKLTNLSKSDLEEKLPALGFPVEFSESEGVEKILVEVTPNRPDLLFGIGLKRLLSEYLGKTSPAPYSASKPAKDYFVSVHPSVFSVRPFIACMVAQGVSISQELFEDLIQFQEKLHTTYGRKRKKIAIGLHDLSKVKFPLSYRAYPISEKSFVPLEGSSSMSLSEILSSHPKGKEYANLVGGHGVVLEDSESVLAFPPIINSSKTSVTTSTTGLFIDVTGTNLFAVQKTLDILSCSLIDLGAKAVAVRSEYPEKFSGASSADYPILSCTKLKLPKPAEARKVLGFELSAKAISSSLSRMGHLVNEGSVLSQPYRADVFGQIDLLEDVAIAHGFNNIAPSLPELFTIGKLDSWKDNLHSIMLSLGFDEVLTWVLSNKSKNSGFFRGEPAAMLNSLTEEFSIVRPMLSPNLLEVFARNKTFDLPQKIYEVGQVSCKQGGTLVTSEKLCAGIMATRLSVNDLVSVLNGLFKELGVSYSVRNCAVPGLIGNRSAEIILGNQSIGFVGEVHPSELERFGIPFPVALFELELAPLRAMQNN